MEVWEAVGTEAMTVNGQRLPSNRERRAWLSAGYYIEVLVQHAVGAHTEIVRDQNNSPELSVVKVACGGLSLSDGQVAEREATRLRHPRHAVVKTVQRERR